MNKERIVELDLGITPEAAVSGAVLIHSETSAFLTFNAMRDSDIPSPHGGFMKNDAGTALIELVHCQISKFGYPNDEARWGIPRTRDLNYGIYEVQDSQWKKEIIELSKHSFLETDSWHRRHFIFCFHDTTLECIAKELIVEVVEDAYQTIWQRIGERVIYE